ncbi:tetratricopeptide repeat protein, partial [Candidatus Omnitrophota bacterium]
MKKVLLILAILCYSTATCFAGSQPKKEVKKGNLLYNRGEFQEALKQYEEALLLVPDSDVVNFNLGNALYKTDDYKNAIDYFEKSLVSNDESLEQKASYNVGNAKFKYGLTQEETDIGSAINLLTQSLRHYERALQLEPEDEDAKFNHEFVQEEIKRLKLKQPQQPQQCQGEPEGEEEQDQQQAQQQQGQQEQSQQGQEESGQSQEQQQQEQQQPAASQGDEEKDEQESQQSGQEQEQ